MAEEIKKDEDWMQKKWRPAMGWMYMIVCMMDMVVFPILWSLLQSLNNGQVTSQWNPLTLQGAGLFHIAMGAVLGIAAFGRTQEKMAGAANNVTAPAPTWPVANTPPVIVAQSTPTPTMSSSGKLAPPPAEQPLL
jgi:hypothetical protein